MTAGVSTALMITRTLPAGWKPADVNAGREARGHHKESYN
jgi:hypothetical protein